ncbi:PREDICTED: V-set and immunoglobulin domain-containing protein 10 isoform X1 [Poecilia mexicana]|uniref:Ig-like domain-containing protein n=1 Tax=Poecilia mexicana TaxID=48701 RepID=A0A3B3YPL5_9TELE|nr:PREDICTED: V-set and immunoglobulin domain-containing protein 10 isoform X1 [Poecilia mexicana]
MNIVASLALLQLFLSAAATVSGNFSTETVQSAAPGDVVLLQCYTGGNLTPVWTTWMKDSHVIASDGELHVDSSAKDPRLTLELNGSLSISKVTSEDTGSFLCSSRLPDNRTINAHVLLQVTSGPYNVTTVIYPTVVLPNRTLVTEEGKSVSFKCSTRPSPSQQLNLTFSGASNNNTSLTFTPLPILEYTIENIQPSNQGVYTCSAVNTVSNRMVNNSTELLVYYIPSRRPDCMSMKAQNSSSVQLNCSWFGAYPTPQLRWGKDGDFQVTDSLVVSLNSSTLKDRQTLTCTARHELLKNGKERSCSVTLSLPFPAGEPMVSVLEGTNVTLSCREFTAVPAANTVWRKGQSQEPIVPGSKYVLSVEGPDLKLTIVNISMYDEVYYFCRSENALGVRELEVFLTVKASSSAYTGAVIGVFIAALITGCAFIVAKILYSRRHTICLGGGFMQAEDRGDVVDLVESDDEQIFQDAVPRLPPLTNGHHTTLVQIHRIPSSDDHEVIVETHPEPPEQKDEPIEEKTEESREEVEELVSF